MRDAVRGTGARDVWPHWSLATDEFIRAAHDMSARVIAWTVNEVTVAQALAASGIDGLCTDDVRVLANL
jgi:glycerophosphoryl diester phosphodiesterase